MYKTIVFLSAVVALSRFLVIELPISINLYYGFWAIIAMLVFIKGFKLGGNCALFIVIGLLSIAFNRIDPIFQPEFRLISFSVMLLAIGPLNTHKNSILFRRDLFRVLCVLIIFMTLLSFPLYFTKFPLFFHQNGLYRGLFNHSMALGPMAGISSVICVQYALIHKIKKEKYILWIMAIVSLLVCLLSGSRGALLSTVFGIAVEIFLMYRQRPQKMVKVILSATIVCVITVPLWYPYTEKIRNKQEANTDSGSTFFSRETLWQDRLSEFEHSPMIGSGFASMDKHIVTQFANDKGGVEPGSSWLFLLSSMGLMGLLSFISIGITPIIKSVKKLSSKSSMHITIVSILSLFYVHMFFEGYVISSGSFLFLFLWLCVGLIQKKSIYILKSKGKQLFTFNSGNDLRQNICN